MLFGTSGRTLGLAFLRTWAIRCTVYNCLCVECGRKVTCSCNEMKTKEREHRCARPYVFQPPRLAATEKPHYYGERPYVPLLSSLWRLLPLEWTESGTQLDQDQLGARSELDQEHIRTRSQLDKWPNQTMPNPDRSMQFAAKYHTLEVIG